MTLREDLLERAGTLFERDGRLLTLPAEGKVVFVGDTHGDLDATERVFRRYRRKPYHTVFLGDYVDRGSHSEENVTCLLEAKCESPGEVFLLAGNHEGFMEREFYPANFWISRSEEERQAYGRLFSKLPLIAASENGILALHGGLPDVADLESVRGIGWGDDHWERVLWGDFVEEEGELLGNWGGRPQLGRSYFERVMKQMKRRILVRSHQPHAPRFMFNKRCVTIFTSRAYLPTRTLLIADLGKDIQTADDVSLERI